MTRPELEALIRETVPPPVADVLLAAADQYGAHLIEEHARSPRSQHDPRQQREMRTA